MNLADVNSQARPRFVCLSAMRASMRKSVHMNRLNMSSHCLLVFEDLMACCALVQDTLGFLIGCRNKTADYFVKFCKITLGLNFNIFKKSFNFAVILQKKILF